MSVFLIVFGSIGVVWLVAVAIYVIDALREHIEMAGRAQYRVVSRDVILPPAMTQADVQQELEGTRRALVKANRHARRAHAAKLRSGRGPADCS